MAAEVDDVVDVLDRDGAFVDTRAARHAVPDDVVGDCVRDERRRLVARVREHLRPLGEDVVAQVHDQELRRELLARRVGRADVLTAPALRARHRVEDPFPRHVGDGAGAETKVLVRAFEAERLEPASGSGLREEHVGAGGRDVQVLRVGEVDEEGQDDQHVRPYEDALEHLGGGAAGEEVGERVRHGRPAVRPLVQPERDLACMPEQECRDDPGDEREDEVGFAEMTPLESSRSLHLADPERGRDPDEHEHAEDVHEEGKPALALEPHERGVRREARLPVDDVDRGEDDRRKQDDESPEDEGVHEPRNEPLEKLLLAEDDHGLVLGPRR